ncbi:DUF6479 family protein [Streptomyces sp. NPDC006678]|uniref:DUF6479 family protein n=1 Tax=Streptomyces sp. NPDC006678 TaxID=3157185 RepID=UPI0033EECE0E
MDILIAGHATLVNGAAIATSNPVLGGVGPFIAGLVIVAVLIGVIPWAIRRRRSQPRPPRPEEQPTAPPHPTHIEQRREADDEAFPDDGSRLTPHQLKPHSTRPASGRQRAHEDEGGAFGSGGLHG